MIHAFRRSLPILACLVTWAAPGQTVRDYCVEVAATVQSSPARITLYWPADPTATNYVVYRKPLSAWTWGSPTSLGLVTNYIDTGVSSGSYFEYRVVKEPAITVPVQGGGTATYPREGYLFAGIQKPMVEDRGKVVLVLDNTMTGPLAMQLRRLERDLAGDGWTVLRLEVARTASPAAVRSQIQSLYAADPSGVKAVFLLGRVPVPYSGSIYPDGHTPDHNGAWPADGYYGEMDGTWTDTTVNNTTSGHARTRNIPGDGKLDQSGFPGAVELQVGRVDLSSLPAFSLSETELLRQYLDKDHNYRHKRWTVTQRGLVDDGFGLATTEPFAANGWRSFAPMFGRTTTVAGDWVPSTTSGGYLFGYGCGAGSYQSANGVVTTSQLATNDPQVVFTMNFGSYFGDWDNSDNLLRATLATPTWTLTCAWAGRPFWMFHPMALGETVGFGARLTMNVAEQGLYDANVIGIGEAWTTHLGLMGDPTLRLHPVAPPTGVNVTPGNPSGMDVAWTASPDASLGYHVYRAPSTNAPFIRLTSSPITQVGYSDPSGAGTNVYMVRAVCLETSASGTYVNLSQGVFQSLNPAVGAVAIDLAVPTNNSIRITPATLALRASVDDPARQVTQVTFLANDSVLGQRTVPPYSLVWTNPPIGRYGLVARASLAGGSTVSATNILTIDHGGKPRLTLSSQGSAWVISGQDPLGRTYGIDAATSLAGPWSVIGTATATNGYFHYTNSIPAPQFFRTKL